jgi:aspartate kinase
LNQISIREAIELAFYAPYCHKTLQPLQKKEIPLYVNHLSIHYLKGQALQKLALEPFLPCFIVKKPTFDFLSSIDFSFIMEENISEILLLFHQFKLKVNLIQNLAISFFLLL